DDVPPRGHVKNISLRRRRQTPIPRISSIAHAISWSAAKKKNAARAAKASTMTVEISVSRREGHVTFAVSDRTCCRNVKGFVVLEAIYRSLFMKLRKTRICCRSPASLKAARSQRRESLPGSRHATKARKAAPGSTHR